MRFQNWPVLSVFACVTLSAGSAVPAAAHNVPLAGMTPFVEDGELVEAATTWGIVWPRGDVFDRVCEEAPGERARFVLQARDAAGGLLLGTSQGLLRTTDHGCTYVPVADETAGHMLTGAAVARDAPDVVYMVSATAGAPGVLWRSTTGGTDAVAIWEGEGVLLSTVATSPDGQTVVAAGLHLASGQPRVLLSRDGGAQFAAATALESENAFVRGLAAEDDGTVGLALAKPDGQNALVRVDAAGAQTVVGTSEKAITAYRRFAGQDLVALGGQVHARWDAVAGAFVEDPSGPGLCLLDVPGDPRLWGCGEVRHGGHFLTTTDGQTWEPVLPPVYVGDFACPAGTPGRVECEIYLVDAGPGTASDAGPSGPGVGPGRDDEKKPSCSAVAPSSLGAFWAALWSVFRVGRRRLLRER